MTNKFNLAWLGITYSCNNKCVWCYSSSNKVQKEKYLKEDKIKSHLDLIYNLGIKKTILIGGEPTVYPYLERLLFEHSKRGIKPGMVTNGRKFSDNNFSKFIRKKGVDSITVSIEGENSQIHDGITQILGSYNETVEGISNLLREGVMVSSNTVITKWNYLCLEKIVDSLKDLELKSISFNICGPCLEENQSDSDFLRPLDSVKAFERVYKYGKSKELNLRLVTPVPLCLFSEETRKELKNKRLASGGPCQLSHGKNFVLDYNGDILPCTHMTGLPLFNIYENINSNSLKDFIEQFNSTIPTQFRSIFKKNASKKCDDKNCYEPCSGGCPLFWKIFDPSKEIKGSEINL